MIGISIGMHAFPSNKDMGNFLQLVKDARQKGWSLFFAKFFTGLIKVANFLQHAWFDLLYASFISMILPGIIYLFFNVV